MPEMVPTHEITPTRERAEGGTLHGWQCLCGETERPRYAHPDDRDRAAARHATKETPPMSRETARRGPVVDGDRADRPTGGEEATEPAATGTHTTTRTRYTGRETGR